MSGRSSKTAQDVGLGVLAREADEHALALAARHAKSCTARKPASRPMPGDAVLAHHAAPDRVVAVEHQHLVRRPPCACAPGGQRRSPARRTSRRCRGCAPAGRPPGRGASVRHSASTAWLPKTAVLGRASSACASLAECAIDRRSERGHRSTGSRAARRPATAASARCVNCGTRRRVRMATRATTPARSTSGSASRTKSSSRKQHARRCRRLRIARQHAARGEQFLEDLVVGREGRWASKPAASQHERERRLEAFGRERRGDGDRPPRRGPVRQSTGGWARGLGVDGVVMRGLGSIRARGAVGIGLAMLAQGSSKWRCMAGTATGCTRAFSTRSRSKNTSLTVRAMISRSRPSVQLRRYSRSYSMRAAILSSVSVSPRRPLTWAQPVMPGLTLWRAM